MQVKKAVDNNITLTLSYSPQGGITSNCGMASISVIAFAAVKTPSNTDAWGSEKQLGGAELKALWEAHFQWVYDSIMAAPELSNKSIICLSDVLLVGLSSTERDQRVKTGDFVRELIKRRIGSVTLSPLVPNAQYKNSTRMIQAAMWIPPAYTTAIISPGASYSGEEVSVVANAEPWYFDMSKRAEVYKDWLGE